MTDTMILGAILSALCVTPGQASWCNGRDVYFAARIAMHRARQRCSVLSLTICDRVTRPCFYPGKAKNYYIGILATRFIR